MRYQAPSPILASAIGSRRILVVDDDELNQRVLTALLESLGCTALVARGGEEALRMLDAGVDLVLLAAFMPGMDGFAVARSIRAGEHAGAPIIMVTTLSGREDRLRAVQAGVSDFIAKPVDKTELMVRMASLLALKDSRDQARTSRRELTRTVRELRRAREELERRTREDAARSRDDRIRQRAAADLLGHIFRLSREGLALTDAGGVVIRVNRAFTAITGYEEREVLGKNQRLFTAGRHDEAFCAEMRRSLDSAGQWSGDVWVSRRRGEPRQVWLDVVAVPEGHCLFMLRDVADASPACP